MLRQQTTQNGEGEDDLGREEDETCECGIAIPGQNRGKKNDSIYKMQHFRQRYFNNLNKVRTIT